MNEPIGIVLGVLSLGFTTAATPGQLREITALGGRRWARAVALALVAAAALVAVHVIFAWPPGWLAGAVYGTYAAGLFRPRWLIRLAGGPVPTLGLMWAHDAMTPLFDDLGTSRANPSAIRAQLNALDRWRTPDTGAYIDLFRSWALGRLEEPPRDDDETREQLVEMSFALLERMRNAGIDLSRVAVERRHPF